MLPRRRRAFGAQVFAQQKRPEQIDVHDLLPLAAEVCSAGTIRADAGVVDQRIGCAVIAPRPPRQVRDEGFRGHIAGDASLRAPPAAAALRASSGLQVQHDDAVSAPSQAALRRRTRRLGRPGDERGFTQGSPLAAETPAWPPRLRSSTRMPSHARPR